MLFFENMHAHKVSEAHTTQSLTQAVEATRSLFAQEKANEKQTPKICAMLWTSEKSRLG